MDLKKTPGSDLRHLWVTKGNYLPEGLKREALELTFDENQEFTYTGKKMGGNAGVLNERKFSEEDKGKILAELEKPEYINLSLDKKLERLKNIFDRPPSKGTLSTWIKEGKPVQSTVIPKD